MRRGSTAAVVLLWALLLTGCQPRQETPLTEQRDEATGFAVRTPPEWTRSDGGGGRIRFVPPGTPVPDASSEFIAVFVTDVSGPLDESGVRRLVFSELTIHGVSGFQQDPRSSPDARWDKFEVTGSSGGVEWASVGVAVSGAAKTYVLVCAKPFDKWRDGQKQCDEVVRTFRPGTLRD
ncbi:MAG TPA: hypothetical protein VGR24_01165 [bacterium]|nr:hypothetical protein [bacterium]